MSITDGDDQVAQLQQIKKNISHKAEVEQTDISKVTTDEEAPSKGSQNSYPDTILESSNIDPSLEAVDDEECSSSQDDVDEEYAKIKAHPSYEQVMLDVNRCAGRLEHIRHCYFHRTDDDEPPEDLTEDFEDAAKGDIHKASSDKSSVDDREKIIRLEEDLKCQRKLKKKLTELIVRLLIKKPELHYYQGFHDVCLTYITRYGHEQALEKLDNLIDSHFAQFMQPTMIETQEFMAMIPIIIGQQDERVQDFLEQAEVGTIFALSWMITWFSHVIPNERDVESIFTFLEKFDDPHVILYLCAEVVIHKRSKLLELEPEMSTVHHFLCQVPRKEKLPIQNLLERTEASFKRWHPSEIKRRLDDHRRAKLQVQNYNVVSSLSQRIIPTLTRFIRVPSPRAALVVFVLASALAMNWDKLLR